MLLLLPKRSLSLDLSSKRYFCCCNYHIFLFWICLWSTYLAYQSLHLCFQGYIIFNKFKTVVSYDTSKIPILPLEVIYTLLYVVVCEFYICPACLQLLVYRLSRLRKLWRPTTPWTMMSSSPTTSTPWLSSFTTQWRNPLHLSRALAWLPWTVHRRTLVCVVFHVEGFLLNPQYFQVKWLISWHWPSTELARPSLPASSLRLSPELPVSRWATDRAPPKDS